MPGIETAAPERTETSSGILVSPNFLPSSFSSIADVLLHFVHQPGGQLAAVLVVQVADLGGDREAGRHRQADAGHLGQVGTLAAQQLLLLAVAFGLGLAEVVDHLGRVFAMFFIPYKVCVPLQVGPCTSIDSLIFFSLESLGGPRENQESTEKRLLNLTDPRQRPPGDQSG